MLVDDEPPARKVLRRLLAEHEDASIVAEAGSIAQARSAIAAAQPDLLFLDIALADGEGFDLVDALPKQAFVVFVTAHPQHALRAFDVAAIDYLLKPVAERRLAGTLKRLRDLRRRSTDQAVETTQLPASPRPDARLTVTVDGRTHLFEPAAIAALRAEGDYTRLQLADGRSLLVGRLLGAFETALHGPPFVRLSRSLLINCDHIAQVTWIAGGRCRLALVEGAVHYDLGRAATKRLRALLSEADNRP